MLRCTGTTREEIASVRCNDDAAQLVSNRGTALSQVAAIDRSAVRAVDAVDNEASRRPAFDAVPANAHT